MLRIQQLKTNCKRKMHSFFDKKTVAGRLLPIRKHREKREGTVASLEITIGELELLCIMP